MGRIARRARLWLLLGTLVFGVGFPSGAALGQQSAGSATLVEGEAAAVLGGVAMLAVGGRRVCTGVLIAPSEALTAAHCVTGLEAGSLSLQFGLGAKGALAVAGVAKVTISPLYVRDAPVTGLGDLGQDMALLTLDRVIGQGEVTPLTVVDWPDPIGGFTDILGYERDGPVGLTRREGCMVIGTEGGASIVTCDVVTGLSGGAVLLQAHPDLPPALVALVSSRSEGRAIVVSISPLLEALRQGFDR